MFSKRIFTAGICANLFLYPAFSQEEGKTLFKTHCTACHSIGKGRLVGPDLKDAHLRYEESRLIKWIRNAPQMINDGDSLAVALYNEYNKVMMSDFSFLQEEQVKSIIAYIKTESESSIVSKAPEAQSTQAVSSSSAEPSASSKSFYINISLVEWILLLACLILFIVIFVQARTIKKISSELQDEYAKPKDNW